MNLDPLLVASQGLLAPLSPLFVAAQGLLPLGDDLPSEGAGGSWMTRPPGKRNKKRRRDEEALLLLLIQ